MFESIERAFGLRTNPPVFFTSAAFILLFLLAGVIWPAQTADLFGTLAAGIARNLGWFYILAVTGIVGFTLWVGISRYGSLRLGPPDSRPEYDNASWFAMLFTAGIGTVLMFYGVAEPTLHYVDNPTRTDGTIEAAQEAVHLAFYHYGLHAWGVFGLAGLALGYFAYRKGLPLSIRSAFQPLLGDRIQGPIGHAIDIFAVLGTIFGVSVSLGLAASQFSAGLEHVTGLPNTQYVQVTAIAAITAFATLSVTRGLDNGIRRLGQVNMVLAVVLLLFVLIAGPTARLLGAFVQNTGYYLQNIVRTSFWTESYRDSAWQADWTLFIWAWQISWSPFVGMFIARISKGRTIREFVFGAMLLPAVFTIFWFTVFGNSAIWMETSGAGLAALVEENLPVALFAMLEMLPFGAPLFTTIALTVVFLFFVTSSDSGSLVVDQITAGGIEDSPVRQRIFWAVTEGAIAAVLLVAGGITALSNVVTTMGLPFCVVLVFVAFGLGRALKQERPAAFPAHPPSPDPAPPA